MGKVIITVPGTISSPRFGKSLPIPDPAGSLYAAYFLGNLYEGGAPLKDRSGNGRDAAQTGAGIGNYELSATNTAYVTAPFSGSTLCALNGACTIVALAQANHDKQVLIGSNFPGAGTEDISLAFQNDSSVNFYTRWGAAAATATIAIPSATRDAGVIACASVHGLTRSSVFCKLPNGAMVGASSTYAAMGGVGGPNNMRMGYAYDGSFGGPGVVAVAAFYQSALTADQVETVLNAMLAVQTGYGIS